MTRANTCLATIPCSSLSPSACTPTSHAMHTGRQHGVGTCHGIVQTPSRRACLVVGTGLQRVCSSPSGTWWERQVAVSMLQKRWMPPPVRPRRHRLFSSNAPAIGTQTQCSAPYYAFPSTMNVECHLCIDIDNCKPSRCLAHLAQCEHERPLPFAVALAKALHALTKTTPLYPVSQQSLHCYLHRAITPPTRAGPLPDPAPHLSLPPPAPPLANYPLPLHHVGAKSTLILTIASVARQFSLVTLNCTPLPQPTPSRMRVCRFDPTVHAPADKKRRRAPCPRAGYLRVPMLVRYSPLQSRHIWTRKLYMGPLLSFD